MSEREEEGQRTQWEQMSYGVSHSYAIEGLAVAASRDVGDSNAVRVYLT